MFGRGEDLFSTNKCSSKEAGIVNIIISEEHHKHLQGFVEFSVEFGSGMKGTAGQGSDCDFLHFIPVPGFMAWDFINHNHQLQYREEGFDHIYTTIPMFMKALCEGDTTINHEIVCHNALDGTPLSNLKHWLDDLNNYRVLKAYLGIAKRDCKDLRKMFKSQDHRAMNKKLSFIKDNMYFVDEILERPFGYGWNIRMNFYDHTCFDEGLSLCEKRIKELRNTLNTQKDSGKIPLNIRKGCYGYLLKLSSIYTKVNYEIDPTIADYYYEAYKRF